ncbi:hypothetical protein L914_05864 [Phytophthora nicotianae]|uniref:Molybdopterin synthase catalytic subunit n=1 Tax=Phytophthora nicotianae TaxID=4792 RepID=W2NNB3_PHYNI|nr:hypothetical protein L914_05864 [Phytophthora nicotianae]
MAGTRTVASHFSTEPGRGDFVEVGYESLDNQRAVALVTHPSAGTISTFVGTTRDNFRGKKVVRLEYEGYTPMAVSELRKICVIVREKWPDVVGVALFHRLGVVEVAEASVVVAVSSPHRREALEACAFAIDTLKATVPIWKSEQYEGDRRTWKENVEWKNGAAARSSCCGSKRVMVPVEPK